MWWWMFVGLAGCGRVAFDAADGASADGGIAESDAGVGFDLDTPSCPLPGFAFLGAASCMPGVLELTADSPDQAGAIWHVNPVAIGASTTFSIELEVAVAHNPAMGNTAGDGMAIVIQNDPRGLAAIGGTGGQLGYENMSPSSAVELDTYRGPNDTYSEEVGIDADGNTVSERVVVAAPFSMVSGTPFTVWVDYSASREIAVSMSQTTTRPPQPLVTHVDDLSRLGVARFGVTASTGGSSSSHRVLRWRLAVRP